MLNHLLRIPFACYYLSRGQSVRPDAVKVVDVRTVDLPDRKATDIYQPGVDEAVRVVVLDPGSHNLKLSSGDITINIRNWGSGRHVSVPVDR